MHYSGVSLSTWAALNYIARRRQQSFCSVFSSLTGRVASISSVVASKALCLSCVISPPTQHCHFLRLISYLN